MNPAMTPLGELLVNEDLKETRTGALDLDYDQFMHDMKKLITETVREVVKEELAKQKPPLVFETGDKNPFAMPTGAPPRYQPSVTINPGAFPGPGGYAPTPWAPTQPWGGTGGVYHNLPSATNTTGGAGMGQQVTSFDLAVEAAAIDAANAQAQFNAQREQQAAIQSDEEWSKAQAESKREYEEAHRRSVAAQKRTIVRQQAKVPTGARKPGPVINEAGTMSEEAVRDMMDASLFPRDWLVKKFIEGRELRKGDKLTFKGPTIKLDLATVQPQSAA